MREEQTFCREMSTDSDWRTANAARRTSAIPCRLERWDHPSLSAPQEKDQTA